MVSYPKGTLFFLILRHCQPAGKTPSVVQRGGDLLGFVDGASKVFSRTWGRVGSNSESVDLNEATGRTRFQVAGEGGMGRCGGDQEEWKQGSSFCRNI